MTAQLDSALWALGRGTGLVALAMFTLTLVLGIATRSGRPVLGVGRFGVAELHRTAALTGTALITLHIGTLFFDPFAQLRVIDFVFPFLGSYRPVWLGLGTLAVDLLVVITVVSLLRERVGPRVFRVVHLSTYILWPLALVHAIGNGSDNGAPWFRAFAGVSVAMVAAALAWRLSTGYVERGRVRIPRSVSR